MVSSRQTGWVAIAFAALVAVCLSAMPSSARAEGWPAPSWETGVAQAENLQLRLVVFGPAKGMTTQFGHTSIVVENTRTGESRLYNYGMFSFDPYLLVRFAMGRLWFWVGQQPEYPTYRFYRRQDRDVRIHELNLPPDKRMQIARFLAWNVKEANRGYLYHHYYDNCATRPRDILDAAVDGALYEATKYETDLTLREHTRRYTHYSLWGDMLLMFMMNDSIDKPVREWDAMFLPDEIQQNVEPLTYTTPSGEERKLIESTTVYYDADDRQIPPGRAPPNWPWALLLGLGLGAGGLALGVWWKRERESTLRRSLFGVYNALLGLVPGLPGLLLFVMALVTDHRVTYLNENLFFANATSAAALPLGIAIALGKDWSEIGRAHV